MRPHFIPQLAAILGPRSLMQPTVLPPAPEAQGDTQTMPPASTKAPAFRLLDAALLALEAGTFLLATALFFAVATFVPSAAFDAWVPLFVALVLTLLANVFLVYAWRRGGLVVRLLVAPTLLPTVYIMSEIIRRTPLFFR